MNDKNDKVNKAIDSEKSLNSCVSTKTQVGQEAELDVGSSKVLDDTWTELAQDWQAQPTPSTDILALVKRTKRRTQGAKLFFALNIIVTLGLVFAFLFGVYDGQWGEPFNIYIGLGSLLSIIFIYFETKIRITSWSQLSDSPEKAIDNAIASSKSSMKYMLISKVSILPFLPLLNWFVYTVDQTSDIAVLPAYLMSNGFLLVAYIVLDYLHRQRKQEYQHLKQLHKA
ncbi:MAG: hypothetical protein ACPG52_11110 [Cognaticolwellia sp.]